MLVRLRRRPWIVAVLAPLLAAAAAWWWWHARPGPAGPTTPIDIPRELTVDAPWFAPASGAPRSGTSAVTIGVARPDGSGLRVGFYETEAQGTGDTWRAAAWMATVVASLTSGMDLRQYVPSFTVEGRIDGPSAGGLLTVALIAALRGDELRPGATMTGTIGPDGTIGPVAGIVHKLEAAKRSGKDLIVIPRGQRRDKSYQDGQMVDVLAYGHRLAIDVHEVDDLVTAYYALTGQRLPALPEVEEEPELPESLRAALHVSAGVWLQAHAERLQVCERLRKATGGRLALGEEFRRARETAERAETLRSAGDVAPAYDQAVTAALQMAVLEQVLRAVTGVADGGMAAIGDRLRRLGADDSRMADSLAKIAGLDLSTPDALVAAADAYGVVAQAAGLRSASKQVADEFAKAAGQASAGDSLLKAAVILALDENMLDIAEDRLLFVSAPRTEAAFAEANISDWAQTLERAASAGLAYFEAICLDESARELGLHPDVLRRSMASQDLGYLLAQSSLEALPALNEEMPETRQADIMTLGTSIGAYTTASALIAKFYSFRAQVDEQGDIVGVEDEARLERTLRLSRDKARAAIAAARSSGMEAALPTFYYLVGRTYASGTVQEKLEALQCFWQASLSARLVVLLQAPPA